jgi:hypothetical protein
MNEPQPPEEELLDCKTLAERLNRNRSYIYAMRRQGFPMPGERATLAEARRWLATHPEPRSRD